MSKLLHINKCALFLFRKFLLSFTSIVCETNKKYTPKQTNKMNKCYCITISSSSSSSSMGAALTDCLEPTGLFRDNGDGDGRFSGDIGRDDRRGTLGGDGGCC